MKRKIPFHLLLPARCKSFYHSTMQSFNILPLKHKIHLGITLIIVFLAAFIVLYTTHLTAKTFLEEGKRRGNALVQNLALQAVDPLLAFDTFRLSNLVMEFASLDTEVVYCFILDHNGAMVAHNYGPTFPVDLLTINPIGEKEDVSVVLIDTGNRQIYDFAAHIKVGGQAIGVVHFGLWQHKLLASMNNLALAITVASIIALAMAIGIGSHFAHRVTRRLNALREHAEYLVQHELALGSSQNTPENEHKAAHPSQAKCHFICDENIAKGDEIEDVVASFNHLSSALKQHINDLHASQKQLLQAQKMESIGALAGGVAHEINTPLGIILGYSQLLQEDVPDGQVRDDLIIIERQTQSCRKIVADLLDFSRQSSTADHKRELCLNNSIMEVVTLVKHSFSIENIVIITDFDDRYPVVYGVPDTLKQVWMNLLNNAKGAMEQGGIINIRTRLDLETMTISADFADTGAGIAKENLQCIFDPFFTTKPVGKGTGLGLSVSFGIVEAHHGYFDVISPLPLEIIEKSTKHGIGKHGTGTLMRVVLPLEFLD